MTSAAGRQYQPLAHTPPARTRGAATRTGARAWLYLFILFGFTPAAFAAAPPLAAPDFILKSTQGENLRLSEYRGQVVLLAFIKTRCRPCEDQLRALDALNKRYAAQGARSFIISADLNLAAASAFGAGLGLSFPILIDPDRRVTALYQAALMPTLVMVDKDGKQRYVHQGYRETDEREYENELRQLLSEWR